MTWKILNTLDLSGAPEAVASLEGVGELVSLPAERHTILARIAEFDAYHASASVIVDPEFLDKAKRLKLIGTPPPVPTTWTSTRSAPVTSSVSLSLRNMI
jgi:hypothetical protein